jgi:hypothetical protein
LLRLLPPVALAAALAALAPPALAESADEVDDPKLARRSAHAPPRMRFLGAACDVGVPDIIGCTLIGRPLKWLRLSLGPRTDTAAIGIGGGVTLVPFDFKVSPSFSVEGGHMFSGGSSFISDHLSQKGYVVDTIAYSYVNLHLGVEAGLPNRVLVFAHLGASFVSLDVNGHERTPPTSGTLTLSDPKLSIWMLSGKLGVVVLFR